MSGLNYYDVDYCKYGMNYRKRTRLWTNIATWKPKPLRKRDCGKIRNARHLETAQRLPCGKKDSWGEGYIKHNQDDLYKIPSDLCKCELGLGWDVLVGDEVVHGFDGLSKTLDCVPAAHRVEDRRPKGSTDTDRLCSETVSSWVSFLWVASFSCC